MAGAAAPAINEQEILKNLGLDGQFKSLAELKKFTADAQTAMKERDTYKTRFNSFGQKASGAGFKSLEEVFQAAAEARKKPANGNGDFKAKLHEMYKSQFSEAEYQALMKENPRILDFWAGAIQEALGTIPTDKFMTKEEKDELMAMVGDQFSERDFFSGLQGEEANLAKQFKNDIRRLYADEKLYNAPDGADDNYNGFSEAWNRYKKNLEKAGVKVNEEKRGPQEQPSRIAFPGSPVSSSAADGDNRPGPGFDEKRFRVENPEVFNEDGTFKWEEGFALGRE